MRGNELIPGVMTMAVSVRFRTESALRGIRYAINV